MWTEQDFLVAINKGNYFFHPGKAGARPPWGIIPFLINGVKTSGGCTMADFPKKACWRCEQESIRITCDPKKEGYVAKMITFYFNAQGGVTHQTLKELCLK